MKSRYGSLKKGKNGAVVNDILSILTFSIPPQEWAVTATTTTPRVNSQHIAIQIAFECERRNQIVSVTHRAGQESKQEKKHPTPQMQKNSDESLDFYATGIYLLRRTWMMGFDESDWGSFSIDSRSFNAGSLLWWPTRNFACGFFSWDGEKQNFSFGWEVLVVGGS